MKLFVTGAGGFVGKNLLKYCQKQNINCVGVDLVSNKKLNIVQADICSNRIEEIIPQGADALIHLAALSRDTDCKNNAYECFKLNVMGTLNLIRAAQSRKAKQFIFASSEWVYDNCSKNKIKTEDSVINIANHISEYALSKLVSEANLRQQYQHGFCPTTILRFGIIYGPRKTNWSAVETLFHSVKSQSKVTVGSLKTGRCFIHVNDIVSGIIKSIGLNGFHTLNLTGDKLVTLKDIIESSKKMLHKNPKVIEIDPKNANIRKILNKKTKNLIQWKPTYSLNAGLKSLTAFI